MVIPTNVMLQQQKSSDKHKLSSAKSERDDAVKKAAGLRKELTELQNVINGECELCDTFVDC